MKIYKASILKKMMAGVLLAAAFTSCSWAVSTKITLTSSMIINEEGSGTPQNLVDEQAGRDPRSGSAPSCWTGWSVPYGSQWFPVHAIIDLGANYRLTDIYLFDRSNADDPGLNSVTISSGGPVVWNDLYTDTLPGFNVWTGRVVNTTTRYVRVTLRGDGMSWFPTEIILYGEYVSAVPPEPPPQAHTSSTVKELIGANVFIDDSLGRMEALGNVREYHSWAWDEGVGYPYPGYPNNQNAFAPGWAAGGGWNFDDYYRNLNAMGITISPVKMQNTNWLAGARGLPLTSKPLSPTATDTQSPWSYVEHADHMWQFAARYGSTVQPDALLKLASNQPRVSGLNLVHYYEDWNEQDATWAGVDARFHPFEYAALASADYDGHLGAMGLTVGVKNADPNAKMVMAGTANSSMDYIRMIKFWADANRGGSMPFDVINVHRYSNTAGGQGGSPTSGVSPEADNLKGVMEKVTDFRNRYMPGKEVWVSEFGYDTNEGSPQRAPAIGTFSAYEVQAQWLVRSYLALTAAGVDRAQMFMLRDNSDTPGMFDSCGMVSSRDTGYVAKTSWYYVYTMKNWLGNMRYQGEQSSGNPNVRIYKFIKDGATVTSAYVVWCPTSNQTSVPSYQLALQAGSTTAKQVALTDGSVNGTVTPLTISAGTVMINVSERPLFVMVNNTDTGFQMSQKVALTPSMVVNESGVGDATMMVDEQSNVGDPLYGNYGIPNATLWNTGYYASAYPASAYIDLGQQQLVTAFGYYDLSGIGGLTISAGSPNNWTVVATDNTTGYLSWRLLPLNVNTRYIRITRAGQGSTFGEVAIYSKPATPSWIGQDIGATGVAGSFTSSATTMTVSGSGPAIWASSDQFQFVYKPITSNVCTISARIVSQSLPQSGWFAVAGVMMRDTTSTISPHIFMGFRPNEALGIHRLPGWNFSDHGTGAALTLPLWVKVIRNGTTFTTQFSSDGVAWTTDSIKTMTLGATVNVGFAVNSSVTTGTSTAVFDNITISP